MTDQEFNEAIKMLYSNNSMIYEDGYQWLIGSTDKQFEYLAMLLSKEINPEHRSKLVELMGHCTKEWVIPILEAELLSEHHDVRFWAYSNLKYFDSPKSREIARKYKIEHPNEDWY